MSKNSVNDEYTDLSENVRHYNNHFLAVLTVSLVIAGTLLSLVSSTTCNLSPLVVRLLKICGILFSLIFWVNGEIYLYRQACFEQRLAKLELELGYKQYSALIEIQKDHWLSKFRIGRWSWRFLHIVICSFWIVTLL